MTANPYDDHLGRNPANYVPLTPLSILPRTAAGEVHASLKG